MSSGRNVADLLRLAGYIFRVFHLAPFGDYAREWSDEIASQNDSVMNEDGVSVNVNDASTYFQLLFVIFHELGHILLGHTDEVRSDSSIKSLSRDERLQRSARNRSFEFEADRYAIDRLLPALFGGLEQFTNALATLFAGIGLSDVGRSKASLELANHPPAHERLARMLQFIDGKNGWTLKANEPRDIIAYGNRIIRAALQVN